MSDRQDNDKRRKHMAHMDDKREAEPMGEYKFSETLGEHLHQGMTVEKAQALLDAFEAKPVYGTFADGGPWMVVPAASGANADIHKHAVGLARAYIAQAAELTRLRAMLTPPDDVQCYTVDALKYNDGLDLPGDMPMVPADVVNRLRARIEAADKLAEAVREITGGLIASGLWLDLQIGKDFLDALSAYEGGKE